MPIHNQYDDFQSKRSAEHFDELIRYSRLTSGLNEREFRFVASHLDSIPFLDSWTSFAYVKLQLLIQQHVIQAIWDWKWERNIDLALFRAMTVSFDEGFTYPSEPLISLKTQLGRIDAIFRRKGISALIMPEIEVVKFQGFDPLVSCYHFNVLIFPDRREPIKPGKLEEYINKLPSVASVLDFPAKVSRKRSGQLPQDYAFGTASYATKLTARLKSVTYQRDGRPQVDASRRDFSVLLALQTLRAKSMLPVLDNIRGVGREGRYIRRALKQRLLADCDRTGVGQKKAVTRSLDYNNKRWDQIWDRLGIRHARHNLPEPGKELADHLRSLRPGPCRMIVTEDQPEV